MLGRKSAFGKLDRRPSQIFRDHFVVAPYPEENVQRVVAEVGIEPIVFGSDFPHGEVSRLPGRLRRGPALSFSEADQAHHELSLAEFLRIPV